MNPRTFFGELRVGRCHVVGNLAIGGMIQSAPGVAQYGISPHVHVCVTSEGSVLLDLKRDKYLGIGREETEILALVVQGWPRPLWTATLEGAAVLVKARAAELCGWMLEGGLLTRREGSGPVPLGIGCRRDMQSDWISVGDEVEVNGAVTWRHCMRFSRAYLWARSSLAWRPFLAIVEEVQGRKAGASLTKPWHLSQVAGLVSVFRRLRPFWFAAEGRCLLHALTLIRFLNNHEFYPEWVIGVTTQPWGAHSWVQWGDYLLDTNPEKVCAYTPILVV
jgi:Transglutaminase-like superfamily